jgi:hypothetical protein
MGISEIKEYPMSLHNNCAAVALALTLAATGASAQQPSPDPHHPGGQPPTAKSTTPMAAMPNGMTASMPMMNMMQMMMGQDDMAGHVEGRIAFLKAELKITEAQVPLWNVVADAMRANAKGMADMPNRMAMMGSAVTLPDKLATDEKAMAASLDALRKLKAAVEPLYAVLDSDQKKTADELMIGSMGMMGMRMM